jgi:hypothetical protein
MRVAVCCCWRAAWRDFRVLRGRVANGFGSVRTPLYGIKLGICLLRAGVPRIPRLRTAALDRDVVRNFRPHDRHIPGPNSPVVYDILLRFCSISAIVGNLIVRVADRLVHIHSAVGLRLGHISARLRRQFLFATVSGQQQRTRSHHRRKIQSISLHVPYPSVPERNVPTATQRWRAAFSVRG